MTMRDGWRELASYSDVASAEVVAGLLRSENVPVHVAADEVVPGLIRDFRLLVPPALLERARSVLQQQQPTEEELAFLADTTAGEEADAGDTGARPLGSR
jgi:Putative prokaryotic signal transducing protein